MPKFLLLESEGCVCGLCGKYREGDWQVYDYTKLVEGDGLKTKSFENWVYSIPMMPTPGSTPSTKVDLGVNYGMIWCQDCGARVVLDPWCTPTLLTFEQAKLKYPSFGASNPEDMSDFYLEVEAAKVDLLVENRLFDLRCPRKLSQLELVEVLRALNATDERQTVFEKFGIFECASNEDELPQLELAFNMSYQVDSYNAFAPKVPFPKEADLSHDGVYLLLKCTSSNGNKFNYIFWGD